MVEGAVRVDRVTGIEERLEQVATPRGSLYTWTAHPPNTRKYVLVCGSVFGDFIANYHRERLLGRSLAAHGIGAIRFHYAGEGNSQGERRELTFATMCEDALAVMNHAATLGFSAFAALGTRLGALVAAAAVAAVPSVPLALWEPMADPLAFITDARRAYRISQLAQDGRTHAPDWRDELKDHGMIDLRGHYVYAPFIDSLNGRDLVDTLGSNPRPIFLVRFRVTSGTSDPVAEKVTERGFSVESSVAGFSESWWLQSERVPESGDLIPTTVSWFKKAFALNDS